MGPAYVAGLIGARDRKTVQPMATFQSGQELQALGHSRGGFTTKIHAKSDASNNIISFDLTGGDAADTPHFETLLDIGPDIQPRAAICGKAYVSKATAARQERAASPRSFRIRPTKITNRNSLQRLLYNARARIEQGMGRIKRPGVSP
jgi:hypothetical protein